MRNDERFTSCISFVAAVIIVRRAFLMHILPNKEPKILEKNTYYIIKILINIYIYMH